jgi:hypothetical protein
MCKRCYQNKYDQENKEAIAEAKAKYYQDNKEARAEYSARYYQDNKEARAEYSARYYQDNKEAKAEYDAKYYKDNREAKLEYYAKYYQDNRETRLEYLEKYRVEYRYEIMGFTSEVIAKIDRSVCRCCGTTDFVRNKVSVDHHHNAGCCTHEWGCTKCFRGIVCNKCNIRIGVVERYTRTNNPKLYKKDWHYEVMKYLNSAEEYRNIIRNNTL